MTKFMKKLRHNSSSITQNQKKHEIRRPKQDNSIQGFKFWHFGNAGNFMVSGVLNIVFIFLTARYFLF